MSNKPANYPQEPKHIWDIFFDITQTPRPSRKEQKMMDYIINMAKDNNLEYKQDAADNIVVYVPSTKGYEDHGAVVIQGHMDMVTQNTPDRVINFETDPLELYVEDGWLKADRTTLGSDNGMGMAAALATILDKTVKHPPLELLFTSDEETGLNGATNLDISMITGSKMLNLDTEDWGEVFIGCAGGLTFDFDRDLDLEVAVANNKTYKITLGGLSGGHSGVQIHEQLGNAIKLLSESLIQCKDLDYQLAKFDGGTAHNVIPRDAHAIVVMNDSTRAEMQTVFDNAVKRFKEYLPKVDEKLFISIEATDKADKTLTKKSRNLLYNCITMVPHGATTYNLVQPADLADLSSNCAQVHCIDGHLKVITSMRYFNVNESVAMDQRHQALAETFELNVSRSSGYPAWTPEFDNPMLDLAKSTYEELYGSVPELKAIHAGLECGILKGKKEDLEIVSFGPTIKGAHSPSERLKIDTVGPFWDLFVAMLGKL